MCFTLSPPLYEYPLLRQTFSDYLILQQTLHLHLLPSAILYNYLFLILFCAHQNLTYTEVDIYLLQSILYLQCLEKRACHQAESSKIVVELIKIYELKGTGEEGEINKEERK